MLPASLEPIDGCPLVFASQALGLKMSTTMLTLRLTDSDRAPLSKPSLEEPTGIHLSSVCVLCAHTCHCAHVEEKTTCESQFSTNTRWGLG